MSAPLLPGYVHPWLADVSWSEVEYLNAVVCKAGQAQHGRTRDGYNPAKEAWESTQGAGPLPFADIVVLCKKCHRLAPFLFYNGNTFSGIVRHMGGKLPLDEAQKTTVVELAGHMVAGVLPYEAEAELLNALKGQGNLPAIRPGSLPLPESRQGRLRRRP